jgi:uncharacterized protein (TIGR03067 family)
MPIQLLVYALVSWLLIGANPKDDVIEREKAKLQGDWKVLSSDANEKVPEDIIKRMTVLIEGDKFILMLREDGNEMTFKLLPDQEPKGIDLSQLLPQVFKVGEKPPPPKYETIRGIYALAGDTLRLCYGQPREDRPKEFGAKPQANYVVLTLQRDKSQTATLNRRIEFAIAEIQKRGGSS